MPIIKGAKKAHRQSERRRVFNLRRKRTMREAVKAVEKAAAGGETQAAEAQLPAAYKAIDKAAKRGVIKDNTAARKKSRLSARVQKAAPAAS